MHVYVTDIIFFFSFFFFKQKTAYEMVTYYGPWTGKIQIARYEILNPQVVVEGNMALLTYNLVNYIRDAKGVESMGSRWNSTTVYQRQSDTWKAIHSHWSFTRHPAFQNMTAEASEGLQA